MIKNYFKNLKALPWALVLLLLVAMQSIVYAAGETITITSPTTGTSVCPGGSITVNFSITGYSTGNKTFTAELSNSSGSFGSGTTTSTTTFSVATNTSGVITLSSVPTTTGTGYLLRVREGSGGGTIYSSNVNITIGAPAAPTANNNTVTYDGSVKTATATPPSGATVVYYTLASGGSVTTAPSGTNAGTYTAWAESSQGGCVSTSRTQVTLIINRKDLTGSFTANNKVYDGNTSASISGYSVVGKVGSDDVNITGGTATFDNANVGTGKTVTLAGATLTGSAAGNYNLTGVSTTTAFIAFKNLELSIIANNKTYDGNTTASISEYLYPGKVGTDDVYISVSIATFDNANVGTGKTVTMTSATLAGTKADNYRMVGVIATTANITAKSITGSFTASNKAYDGNTSATVGTYSVVGKVGSDDVNITGGTATFNTKTVGTGKTVTLAGATLTGGDAGNYNLTSVATTTADITALSVTGTFASANKAYDGNTSAAANSLAVVGAIGGDAVSLTGGTATFNTKTVGAGKTVTLAGAALTGADAGNYTLTSVATTTADITALSVTGTFASANKAYDGNTSAAANSLAVVGAIGGDAVSLTGGTATFNTKTVGAGKTVTLAGATLSGADAGNYTLTSVATTTADITVLSVTGTFASANKAYDGNTSAAANSLAVVGVLGGDAVALTGGTAAFNTKTVGAGKTVTLTGAALSGADAGNYTLTSVATTTADITALSVTGTFASANKAYDGNTNAAANSRAVVGAIGGDAVSLTGGTATFNNKNVGTGKTVTLAGATLSGGDAGNYNLTSVATTTADITALSVTGTFASANKAYDGNTSAAANSRAVVGAIGGDAVSLTGGTAAFNTKTVGTGKAVTLTGAALSGADAGNYNLTSVATTTADITALSVTGTFASANKVYDGTTSAAANSRAVVGALGGDVVSLTGGTAAFNTKTVGTGKAVTLTGAALSGADAGNYMLTSVATTTADITILSVTGTFTSANKVYDGNTSAAANSLAVVGAIGGDAVSLTGGTATFDNANVGTGKTVTLAGATLSGADAGNYSLTSVATTTADITLRPITVTADAKTKVYGTSDPALTYQISGSLVNGDAFSGALTRVAGEDAPGPYAINQGSLLLTSNYNLIYVGANLTITPQNATPMSTSFYTGSTFFWTTSSTSSTASLVLVATLKNSPNYGGDISSAKINFYINGTLVAKNQPVGLVNPGDQTVGTATAVVQYNLGNNSTADNVMVKVEVTGNYTSTQSPGTTSTVMVAQPVAGGQIVGGANLTDEGSAGIVKGSSNVSFVVKYNKSLKNPQGGVELLITSKYDRNGVYDPLVPHEYKISSNAISTLAVGQPTPNVAQFTGKANIAEFKNGVYEAIEGNCSMVFDLKDVSVSGNGDLVAISVYSSKGGMWFASKWDGTNPVLKTIIYPGGNISVSGATGLTARESFEAEPAPLLRMNVEVVASPNPVSDQLRVIVTEAGMQPSVRINLMGMDQRLQGTYTVPVQEGRAEQTIDVKGLQEGMYIITVDGAHGRVTRKVLKMN